MALLLLDGLELRPAFLDAEELVETRTVQLLDDPVGLRY